MHAKHCALNPGAVNGALREADTPLQADLILQDGARLLGGWEQYGQHRQEA